MAQRTLSKSCKSLLEGLLEKDPDARLDINEALGHSWFWHSSENALDTTLEL